MPPLEDLGKAREKAAKAAGVSARYVSDAKKLKAAQPDLYQKVYSGHLNLPQAKQEVKARAKKKIVESIAQEPRPLPTGPYRVIAVDPPWPYREEKIQRIDPVIPTQT
jgi:hypothetical protein